MIVLGLQRWHGNLVDLGAGCWLVFGAKVFFRCPECEGLYDASIKSVDLHGFVTFGGLDGPFFFCATPACGFVRGIRLDGWPKFDTSDVTS